tara:strand:- start:133 stop:831 length:699 start_codon:yes stop_codon:yes gene_type:complete
MSKQPPRVQLNFEPEKLPDEVEMQVNDYDEEVIDNLHEDELEMPKVVGKPKVEENDIFDDIPKKEKEINPSMNGMGEDLIVNEKPKKVKKPRKPMSEEHKQKLALAREKAMAVRKAKAEEKRKMKEIEKQTNELKNKKKVKEFEELKDQVESKTPKKEVELIEPRHSGITKKDLEEAQYQAILKYETLRKERKAEKKRQQQIEADKQNIIKQIQPQKSYTYRDGSNKWDMCY